MFYTSRNITLNLLCDGLVQKNKNHDLIIKEKTYHELITDMRHGNIDN